MLGKCWFIQQKFSFHPYLALDSGGVAWPVRLTVWSGGQTPDLQHPEPTGAGQAGGQPCVWKSHRVERGGFLAVWSVSALAAWSRPCGAWVGGWGCFCTPGSASPIPPLPREAGLVPCACVWEGLLEGQAKDAAPPRWPAWSQHCLLSS